MMKEDRTEQLKRKMSGHKMPPPEGLWECITKQMGQTVEPVSKKPVIGRWWWAAAAVVLALVGFYVFYQHDNNAASLQAEAIPLPSKQTKLSESSKQIIPSEPSLVSMSSSAQKPLVKNKKEKALVLAVPQKEMTSLPDSAVKIVETQQTPDKPEKKSSPKMVNNNPAVLYESVPEHSSPSRSGNWSVGINASGGLLAANTSQRIDREQAYGTTHFSSSYMEYVEYESKHHLPLRFGLSLQYQLNDRLALLSGINYTYLYSEFSIPQFYYPSGCYDQKLHYLGLPLGLSWQLLNAGRFHLYLTGGVMLEKCLNEKPWQWSVNGAAGAEYAITSLFGIYLEPSLGYYFSDGTQFEHYYKEHPLAPSIEFGLRLHIGQPR